MLGVLKYITHYHFFKFKSPCSVFVTELTALFFACNSIKDCTPNFYNIFSYSLSCLHALNTVIFDTHYIILMMKKLLLKLNSQGFIIKFVWIPSFSNIYGNKQPDSLAKFGVNRGMMYNRNISASEHYSNLKKIFLVNLQNC